MKKKQAFTLIEVVISIAISSFIMIAMIQVYRNVVRYIERTRQLNYTNKKVWLLFDQLEKDISNSFIPKDINLDASYYAKASADAKAMADRSKDKEKDSDKKNKDKTDKKEETKKPVPLKKGKEKTVNFFKIDIFEDEGIREKGQKRELFKSINFITTNPLLIYREKKRRIVRVMYELVKDKGKSTYDKNVYNLYRRETLDLKNIKFEEPEEYGKIKKEDFIQTYLVASNIKYMSLQAINFVPSEESFYAKASKDKQEEHEKVKTFVWGQEEEKAKLSKDKKKKEKPQIPQSIDINVDFWNDDLKNDYKFELSIPIFSYSFFKEVEKNKNEKKGGKRPEAKGKKTSAKTPAKTRGKK